MKIAGLITLAAVTVTSGLFLSMAILAGNSTGMFWYGLMTITSGVSLKVATR